MKVCIPTETDEGLGASVCPHFGQAPFFTVVDTETKDVSSSPNQGHHVAGARTPAEIIADKGVDAVIVGGCGPRAVQIFAAKGIRVYQGGSGTVAEVIEKLEADGLQVASEETACKDHQH